MNTRSSPIVSQTSALVLELHGPDYFGHLDRVRGYFLELAALLPAGVLSYRDIEDGELAALLHDSYEDGHITLAALSARGYSSRVVALVNGLTRFPSLQTYQDKMAETAASGDIVLILCKLGDNRDNSDPDRVALLPEEKRNIVKRYRKARRTLFDGLAVALRLKDIDEAAIKRIEMWLGNRDTVSW